MKIRDLDFKKLGLTNKRSEFIARHYEYSIFRGLSENQVRKQFIALVNRKGYVPLNIRFEPESKHYKTSSASIETYGTISAYCIYFGKRNAWKIRELESEKNKLVLYKEIKD